MARRTLPTRGLARIIHLVTVLANTSTSSPAPQARNVTKPGIRVTSYSPVLTPLPVFNSGITCMVPISEVSTFTWLLVPSSHGNCCGL
ncbi:hypothetical protein DPMN_003994 [Dreissena polymorpha]|uniref:Secreted protein n=1 Tax=Dreissena polymorpha TaxID=45954 RepID=A0A9D4RVH3_DREPO|nr:hypothetical protein DPMN_003994 [Dreissena polymorpha]